MNILVCLLSQQHVPNLLSVQHEKPDFLVLVESEAMRRNHASKHFLTALDLGGLGYADRCEILPLDDVADFIAIRKCFQGLYGKYPQDTWTINLAGGTKPMSIVAYEFFKAVGARLLYIEFSRPGYIIQIEPPQTLQCLYKPTISEFLAGYGFEQKKSQQKIQAAEDRALQCYEAARTIAEHAPQQNLLDLDRDTWNKARDKGLDLPPGSLRPQSIEVRKSLVDTFNLREAADQGLTGTVDKYVIQFLTGGWLESFLWNILSRYADPLGVWDVRLGLEPAAGASTNDFDIAFMHNYALNMIECKSGSQSHDRDGDVLYKIEAVTRQFRALGVRSWLATTSQNIFNDHNNLKPQLRDRADIYACRFLTASEIQHLARNHQSTTTVKDIFSK